MGWDGLYKSKSEGTDTLELEEDCLFWGGQNVAGSDTDAELEDGACGFCGGHAFGGFTVVDATRLCSVLEAEVLGLSEAACSLLLAGALSSTEAACMEGEGQGAFFNEPLMHFLCLIKTGLIIIYKSLLH